MSKKRKKHGYAERLKYMHMLENGLNIHLHDGINEQLCRQITNLAERVQTLTERVQ